MALDTVPYQWFGRIKAYTVLEIDPESLEMSTPLKEDGGSLNQKTTSRVVRKEVVVVVVSFYCLQKKFKKNIKR